MSNEFRFHELKNADRLPSPSGTALAIMKLTQKPDATLQQLAQLVQTDPALSGRLLRVANSAGIGLRRPIVSVLEAIALQGIGTVRQFAISLSLIGNHQQGRCQGFNYPRYWALSLARAVAIHMLSLRERTVLPEEAFSVGLLADIGQLALATAWPDEYSDCLREGKGDDLIELEREQFAIDEDALSLMLMADWGFPRVFLDAVSQSLSPRINDNSRISHFAVQLSLSRKLAEYCLADDAYRRELQPQLAENASACGIADTALPDFLENLDAEWHAWGSLIGVSTDIREPMPEAPAAPETAENTEDEGFGLHILLVDDDPLLLLLLSKQLEQEGHRVSVCKNGEDALVHAFEHKPELVITDWQMKPMDGLSLCRALRGSPLARKLYIMMLTSTESEDGLIEAFEAGIDDYVTKPISPRVFNARLRAAHRIIALQQDLEREQRDIERYMSELAVANRRLELMANTDLLTGLPNRRYSLNRLEQEWASAARSRKPLSLLLLDLDQFKSINDSLGHDAGDKVLQHAAKIMRKEVRANDVVCRLGGEEFLVISADSDTQSAMKTAERIRSAIETHQPELPLIRPLTTSIGVAGTVASRRCWQDLMKAADKALYKAKQSGRNRIQLAPDN